MTYWTFLGMAALTVLPVCSWARPSIRIFEINSEGYISIPSEKDEITLQKSKSLVAFSPNRGTSRPIDRAALGHPTPFGEVGYQVYINKFDFDCDPCWAIASDAPVLAEEKFSEVELGNRPPQLSLKEIAGINDKNSEVVYRFLKTGSHSELLLAKIYTRDHEAVCGRGGYAYEQVGYVKSNGSWKAINVAQPNSGLSKQEYNERRDQRGLGIWSVRQGRGGGGEVVIKVENNLLFVKGSHTHVVPIFAFSTSSSGC